MLINNFDTDKKVLIIAEIGNNHEGCFDTAVKMIKKAAETGVDAVKVQVIVPEKLVNIKQTERIKKLRSFAFTQEQFSELSKIARASGLMYIASVFDTGSIDYTATISDALKIASSDNNFYPLIDKCVNTNIPVIASTGLAKEQELSKLVEYLPASKIALLHCVCAYPVPLNEVNLSMIPKLKKLFPEYTVGYSDHSLGIDAASLAVAAGARIIEKHFTLDKEFSDFRDHQLSADPKDMVELVKSVRKAELFLGNGDFIQDSEKVNLCPVRRSIVAATPLKAGHIIRLEDMAWVRPGEDMPPGSEDAIIGKKLSCDLEMHQAFKMEMFE